MYCYGVLSFRPGIERRILTHRCTLGLICANLVFWKGFPEAFSVGAKGFVPLSFTAPKWLGFTAFSEASSTSGASGASAAAAALRMLWQRSESLTSCGFGRERRRPTGSKRCACNCTESRSILVHLGKLKSTQINTKSPHFFMFFFTFHASAFVYKFLSG